MSSHHQHHPAPAGTNGMVATAGYSAGPSTVASSSGQHTTTSMTPQQQQQYLMQQQQQQQQQQMMMRQQQQQQQQATAIPNSSGGGGGASSSAAAAPVARAPQSDPHAWFQHKQQQMNAIHQQIRDYKTRYIECEAQLVHAQQAGNQPLYQQIRASMLQMQQAVQQLQQQQHIQAQVAQQQQLYQQHQQQQQLQQLQQMQMQQAQQQQQHAASSSSHHQQNPQQQQQHAQPTAGTAAPSAAPSTQRFGPYIVGETIGRGSFGKVKIAIHETTGVKVALKVISRKSIEADARSQLKLHREIRVLRLLKHPHIMRLYDVVQTRLDIVLVLELVSGGELFVYLARRGRLEESQARMFFQQLVAAIAHCHNAGVVHRDLKPENILVEASHRGVKIGDFGLSSIAYDGKVFETSCGTPNYAAPEVVGGRVYVGREADIWSSGVVLFTMLAGTLPFDDEQLSNLFRKIQTANYTMPSFISPAAQDLITKILVVNPLDRATSAQILNHPWLRESFPPYLALLHGEALAENTIFPHRYNGQQQQPSSPLGIASGPSSQSSNASANPSFAGKSTSSAAGAGANAEASPKDASGAEGASAAATTATATGAPTADEAAANTTATNNNTTNNTTTTNNNSSNSSSPASSAPPTRTATEAGGDYYLTEAAKHNHDEATSSKAVAAGGSAASPIDGPSPSSPASASMNTVSTATQNNTATTTATATTATAAAKQQQQQQQQELLDASEQLRKRDAYRNVIDINLVVQLAERFRTSSRKVMDQLIANPAGQYALNTDATRHTLIDKKVADSVMVTIPSADLVLRSEAHDMCISYSILLDKKRNAELNEYKKLSAQWSNQTPAATFSENSAGAPMANSVGGSAASGRGTAAASSSALLGQHQPLLQPNEMVAQTQTQLDARRAATMVQDGSPEAKARLGANHALGTYRSTAGASNSTASPASLSNNTSFGGRAALHSNASNYMQSIPASYGWGSVSQFGGGGGGGGRTQQQGSYLGGGASSYLGASSQSTTPSGGGVGGGGGLLLNSTAAANSAAASQHLLTPAGPGPQRTAHVFSMGVGAMSLNPASQSLQPYSMGGVRQHAAQHFTGQGTAAGGAVSGFAQQQQQQQGMMARGDPLDAVVVGGEQYAFIPDPLFLPPPAITEESYVACYNKVMGLRVRGAPPIVAVNPSHHHDAKRSGSHGDLKGIAGNNGGGSSDLMSIASGAGGGGEERSVSYGIGSSSTNTNVYADPNATAHVGGVAVVAGGGGGGGGSFGSSGPVPITSASQHHHDPNHNGLDSTDSNGNNSTAMLAKSPSVVPNSAPRRMKQRLPNLGGGGGFTSPTMSMASNGGGNGCTNGDGATGSMNSSLSARPPLPPAATTTTTAPASTRGSGAVLGSETNNNNTSHNTVGMSRGNSPPPTDGSLPPLAPHGSSPAAAAAAHLAAAPPPLLPPSMFHNGVLFSHLTSGNAVLACVYDALFRLGFLWKMTKPFQIAAVANSPVPVKLFVRLFRAVERRPEYVVDVRLSSHSLGAFGAIDIAAELIDWLMRAARGENISSGPVVGPSPNAEAEVDAAIAQQQHAVVGGDASSSTGGGATLVAAQPTADATNSPATAAVSTPAAAAQSEGAASSSAPQPSSVAVPVAGTANVSAAVACEQQQHEQRRVDDDGSPLPSTPPAAKERQQAE